MGRLRLDPIIRQGGMIDKVGLPDLALVLWHSEWLSEPKQAGAKCHEANRTEWLGAGRLGYPLP